MACMQEAAGAGGLVWWAAVAMCKVAWHLTDQAVVHCDSVFAMDLVKSVTWLLQGLHRQRSLRIVRLVQPLTGFDPSLAPEAEHQVHPLMILGIVP